MRATVQRNFVISLRAVHTRLTSLVAQAKTKDMLEPDVGGCSEDLAHAAEDLKRALQHCENIEAGKIPKR